MKVKLDMIFGLLLTAAIGCGSQPDDRLETAPVSVEVKYNGTPVSEAVVTFSNQTDSPPAYGVTNASGVAMLSTFESNDGAILGEHSVAIIKQEFGNKSQEAPQESDDYVPSPGASPPPVIKDLLPKKFSQATTSGLTANVKKGPNEFTFDLTDK